MTTIAYKDGVLAADTLITQGNERSGYIQKIGRITSEDGTVLYGACGALAPAQQFMRWVSEGMKEGEFDPSVAFAGEDGEPMGEAFIIHDGIAVKFYKWGVVKFPITEAAWGSGGDYARGAMACGASAAEAVAAAVTIDTASGGEITVLASEDFQSQDAK